MSVFVFSILAALCGIVVILSTVQKSLRNVVHSFQALGLLILGWMLSEVIYFLTKTPAAAAFFVNTKLPFVAFSVMALYILVLRFYRLDRYVTLRFKLLLAVIPAITTVLCLTSPWHSLMRADLEVVQLEPMHILHATRGVWFWVHAAYCYILIVVAAVLVLTQHRKLPSGFRAPSFIMIMVMLLTSASNIISISMEIPLDITAVGMAVSLLLIYAATAASSQSDLPVIARDEIFNSMGESVFILDPQRQVRDANPAGLQFLRQLDLHNALPMEYTDVLDRLREQGATIRNSEDEDGGLDIYFATQDRGVVYNLQERAISDKGGRVIGVYSILADVTRYKRVIDRLERTVDIDPLTGLASRKVFEELKERYAREHTLPLAVILGDANGLKRVNDRLGHQQGDEMLRVIARQLRAHCPEGGTVARIGGDEFLMFLPGVERAAAAQVAAQVDAGLAAEKGLPFTPSLALGLASRRVADGVPEDMDDLVRRADAGMYTNKQNDRRRSRRESGEHAVPAATASGKPAQ